MRRLMSGLFVCSFASSATSAEPAGTATCQPYSGGRNSHVRTSFFHFPLRLRW